MPIELNRRAARRVLLLWLIFASAICAAQVSLAPAWKTKSPAQWTESDAQQILDNSPWAGEVPAIISGRLSEDQLREAGRMGQPTGVGYEGIDPKGSGPKVDLNIFTGAGGDDRSLRSRPRGTSMRVVWESALPIRLAELKTHVSEPPTLDGEGYQIAVYGIPGPEFRDDPKKLGDPLRKDAVLRRTGKKDVKPVKVEVFQRQDGLVAVYLFPLSAELSKKDLWVIFDAQIGRIHLAHTFDLREMEILGKLEI